MNPERSASYTSLRDIIYDTSTLQSVDFIERGTYNYNRVRSIGTSNINISIRNQLVKHAASVYLQSAMIVANPNPNWFIRFWNRVWVMNSGLQYCLNVYVNPCRECCLPIYQYLVHTLGELVNNLQRRIVAI